MYIAYYATQHYTFETQAYIMSLVMPKCYMIMRMGMLTLSSPLTHLSSLTNAHLKLYLATS